MDDVVPCINYLSGVGYSYIPVLLKDTVHCLPNNFNVPLYCPLQTDVFIKRIESFRSVLKKGIYFHYCIQNILHNEYLKSK